MHYKGGTPASAGDLVIKTDIHNTTGSQTVGILTGAQSQSTTCNGYIVPVAYRQLSELGWGPWMGIAGRGDSCWPVTLSQCERIDKMPSEQPAAVKENEAAPLPDAAPSAEATTAA